MTFCEKQISPLVLLINYGGAQLYLKCMVIFSYIAGLGKKNKKNQCFMLCGFYEFYEIQVHLKKKKD